MANPEEQASQSVVTQKFEHTLPKEKGDFSDLLFYQEFWCPSYLLRNVIFLQQHFQPQDSGIILASKPKCGTTWLKALMYSIIHRSHFTDSNHPLLTKNPHQLVRSLEHQVYMAPDNTSYSSYLKKISDQNRKDATTAELESNSPRLFSTHLPYGSLPELIKMGPDSKIVYVARNPFDTLVSHWKFATQVRPQLLQDMSFECFVERFCEGVEQFGPYWDHVLGYWKQSLERPDKVLFLKFEDMLEDGVKEMKKLAKFMGYGFTPEEERQGVIEEIQKLCSIGNLKKLEVNMRSVGKVFYDAFFRKGEVGDWINHLSPSMIDRLDQITKTKFASSGLEFKMLL